MNFSRSRKFLIGSLPIALALMAWGFFLEPGLLTQKNIIAPRWNGPPLKIAFFSDLHAGSPHITENYIRNLVKRINDNSPDLILIGGDLLINQVLGGNFTPIEKVADLLKELKAPLGTFAVLGNHDWWNEGDHIRKVLEASGIAVLENESRSIGLPNNFKFWLIGIGDDYTKHADLEKAFSKVTGAEPKIIFMHDPGILLDLKRPFDFALAGHMHGGQVYVPGFGALIIPGRAPKEWAGGWANFEFGSLYVSKGVGTSILPVRFNALPEFVILSLSGQ